MRLRTTGRIFLLELGLLLIASSLNASESKKINLGVAGKGVSYFSMVVAAKKGFIKEEGFEPNFLVLAASARVAGAVAGGLDYSMGGMDSLYGAVVQGLPLKTVGVISIRPQHAIVAKKGRFRSVSDLKGKMIASQAAIVARVQLAQAFLSAGLDPRKDLKEVNVGEPAARYASLVAGTTDAAWFDAARIPKAEDDGYEVIVWLKELSSLPLADIVTSQKKLQGETREVKSFLRAVVRGARYLRDPAHKAEIIQMMSEWSGLKLEVASKVYQNVIDTYAPDLILPEAALKDIEAGIRAVPELRPLTVDEMKPVFDFSILRQVLKELGR